MTNAKSKLTHQEVLAIGRLELKRKWPYFDKTLMGLVPFPTLEVPTFAVTPGMVMAYNPEFAVTLTGEMAASEMVHECSHVVRGHLNMFRNYPEKYYDLVNIGMDLAINPDIKAAGWVLHPTWIFPEHYDLPTGLTASEYIEELIKQREANKEKPMKGHRSCFPPQGVQASLDAHGRTEVEKKRILKATVGDMKAFAAKGGGRGNIPGFLKELITLAEQEARIPWRDRLEALALHASGQILSGGSDYSLRRPSKRSYTRGILRPGLVDHMMNAALIIDTSASMNQKQMLIGMAESVNIMEQMGIDRAWYLQADTQVSMKPEYLSIEQLRNIPGFTGRGGTDFRPAFAEAEKLLPRPEIIFYFTDGDGWAPPQNPEGIHVIWCVIPGSYGVPHRPAAWGEVVLITDKDLDERQLGPVLGPPGQSKDDEDE